MDYEKKYNEALAWMRSVYSTLQGATKEDAEHYFPELRESEDERIRKELIEYLRGDLDDITTDDTDRWINWLEKQKEQKPVEYLPKQKVFDIMNKLTNLSYSERIPIDSEEYVKIHEITSDVNSLLDYPIKPVEWSEEDENMRLEAIRVLVSGCERYRRESGCLPAWHETIDWLKSLRPIVNANSEKVNVNWSEEDEEIFNNIIEKAKGGHWIEVNEITWLINRFKSLRPQWKPTEEQMKALIDCTIGNEYDVHALVRLWAELKKL